MVAAWHVEFGATQAIVGLGASSERVLRNPHIPLMSPERDWKRDRSTHAAARRCYDSLVAPRLHLALALMTGGLCACLEDPGLPDIQWEGEVIQFAAEDPEQVCGGSKGYLDLHAQRLLSHFGSDSPVEFYFLEDVSSLCGSKLDVIGCAEPGVVYSESVPHFHEVVHARPGDGLPPVLEEGLATYFGDPYPIRSQSSRERLIEFLTDNPRGIENSNDYARAAHFVAFLVETHGLDSLRELDSRLSPTDSPSTLASAVSETYGQTLDLLLTAYEGYPECSGVVDVNLLCDSPGIAPDGVITTIDRSLDCSAPDILGPRDGMIFSSDVIELQPTVAGTRTLRLSGPDAEIGGYVLIRRCGPCPENGVGKINPGVSLISEDELPAGRYLVRMYLPLTAGPQDFSLEISQ